MWMVYSAVLVHCLHLIELESKLWESLSPNRSNLRRTYHKNELSCYAGLLSDEHIKNERVLARFKHPSEAINTMLDKKARKRMEDNQKVMESLLNVIMVCGKQVLTLCTHRDDQIDFVEQKE